MLMRTGEIGDGAQQQYASNPGAQVGSSAGFVAGFLAEILPKEAEGGTRVRQQNWPFWRLCDVLRRGLIFSWKKSPTR